MYLDNGATTCVAKEVVEAMNPYFSDKYGNASSTHVLGRDAKDAVENAREIIAKSIGARAEEIIFTSGGTESNNLAIKGIAADATDLCSMRTHKGIAFTNKNKGKHIITTRIEHKCVLESCKWLEKQGLVVSYLGVDKEGFVNVEELERCIREDTIMVSVIHGNNEIGTIQDLESIGKICKKNGIYFHTDACQSYTKTELNVKKQGLDLVTINAHKIHGPKGVGALYVKKGIKIGVWQHGGGQESGLRSGTENVAGIVGFAKAVKLSMDKKHIEKMSLLQDKLIKGVLKIEGVKMNGPRVGKRLCNNANFSFKGIEGEALGGYLDQKGVCSSTGSACSEKLLEPSYVLKAIGLSDEDANGSLRLTLSRYNSEKEIDYVIKVLPAIVKKLRRISPFGRLTDYVFKKSN